MTNLSFGMLNGLLERYPFKSEPKFDISKNMTLRKRTVDVFMLSKYSPKRITIYSVAGNLNYNNSFVVMEYLNAVIINCYLQAGSKFSPGQEDKWFHYSRCRKQELKAIRKIIESANYQVPVIIAGDINSNLNGPLNDWPEIEEFKKMYMIDSWQRVNGRDKKKSKRFGFTEDTNINLMRWNNKFQEKRFRYDGILYKNPIFQKENEKRFSIHAKDSWIVGKKGIILDDYNTKRFIKFMTRDVNDDEKNKLLKYSDEDNKLLALWPSDHFGVITRFSFQ